MKPSNGKHSLWAELYPELGTEPIPTDRCFSPEYYALERERVFKRVWLKVGRVEEIPEPRDYKVKRVEVANTSILLVRGDDGQIRGFHNVCSHRGNKVVWGDDTYGLRQRGVAEPLSVISTAGPITCAASWFRCRRRSCSSISTAAPMG